MPTSTGLRSLQPTLGWRFSGDPPQTKQDWLENFVKNSLTITISFIPGVGPVAAIAFPLIWTAIADPDSFVDTWRSLCPGLDLQLKVLEAIRDSAKQTRECLPDGWEESALGPKFLAPRRPGTVHAMAALTSEGGDSGNAEARELVVTSEQYSTESLTDNERTAVAGQKVDYKALVAEARRLEEEIVVLEAEQDRLEGIDLDPEDNRLDDELGDEAIPDQVTLDEIGPNLYSRLTEQVPKETATKAEESEWEKLVEIAIDTAKDITSKLPTLPGLGGKKETAPARIRRRVMDR